MGSPDSLSQMSFVILRHCQKTEDGPDAPLSEQGLADALGVADLLAPLNIDRVYSSPYLRALQTIQPLADQIGAPVTIDGRLSEWLLSETAFSNIKDHVLDIMVDPSHRPPFSESGDEVWHRVKPFLEEVNRSECRLPVFSCHGGLAGQILWRLADNWVIDDFLEFGQPGIVRFERGDWQSYKLPEP